MGPEASKMSPWAPKITQNHKSDHPKSRTCQKKNGTVAVYAHSALDIYIYIYIYLHIYIHKERERERERERQKDKYRSDRFSLWDVLSPVA